MWPGTGLTTPVPESWPGPNTGPARLPLDPESQTDRGRREREEQRKETVGQQLGLWLWLWCGCGCGCGEVKSTGHAISVLTGPRARQPTWVNCREVSPVLAEEESLSREGGLRLPDSTVNTSSASWPAFHRLEVKH